MDDRERTAFWSIRTKIAGVKIFNQFPSDIGPNQPGPVLAS